MRFPACIYGTTGDQVPVDSQKKICKKTAENQMLYLMGSSVGW